MDIKLNKNGILPLEGSGFPKKHRNRNSLIYKFAIAGVGPALAGLNWRKIFEYGHSFNNICFHFYQLTC